MKTVCVDELELEPAWSEGDPTLRTRDGYLLHAGHGTTASSAVLFEIDPGCHIGRHFHTAEEMVLVLEGSVEVTVGDETAAVPRGGVAFAPALVWHNVRCASDEPARCVGFFAAASVDSVYEDVVMPDETRVRGTPAPEPPRDS
jgi:quercetin dioxygenase-like cupin family protein